jgi:hypothetical protein
MSAAWVPPRATYHLRIFVLSLLLIVLFLAVLLFGVEIEAVAPATGIITARDLRELRAPVGGLVEHRLRPGDELAAGAVLATLRSDDTSTPLHIPADNGPWLVLEVRAAPLSAVRPGDVVAVVVPVDPQTHQPRDLVARLDVDEKHWGSLAVGQKVRLHSAVYNHRLFGSAEARLDRLEPYAEPAAGGERRFHALAPVTQAPFALPLGSSFQAEVVVGRKLVYRVILEH